MYVPVMCSAMMPARKRSSALIFMNAENFQMQRLALDQLYGRLKKARKEKNCKCGCLDAKQA